MIEPAHPQLSIVRQCDLLGLPRSSYYREVKPQTPDVATLELMRLIDGIYLEHPFFGTRQTSNSESPKSPRRLTSYGAKQNNSSG